jgi:cyclic beta-1,2-glucan synthetase
MLVEIDDFAGRRRPRLKSALSLQFRRWQGARGPSPPWDDGAPIRAELFSVERLEEHAHSLATAQAVTPGYVKGASLSMRLADNEAVLLAAYRDVAKAVDAGAAITPMAEWLIDNFHVVEKQIHEVRVDLPPGYYRQLPKLASGPFAGYPRVLGVAWHYHFRLLALSVDRLALHKDPSCRNVEQEARKHVLAEAVLVSVYER